MSDSQPILSPCIGICTMDVSGERCMGCGRSRQEITDWVFMHPEDREKIMARLEAEGFE